MTDPRLKSKSLLKNMEDLSEISNNNFNKVLEIKIANPKVKIDFINCQIIEKIGTNVFMISFKS